MVMPLNIGMRIPATEPVRVLMEVTERLDYSKLRRTYQRPARKDEATAKQLFQLTVLGFLHGQYSTRALESACRYDIRFQYILSGKHVPDHTRFARFIQQHLQGDVAEDLFYQIVLCLHDMGEIGYEHLFADGTKTEANANRYSFVWEKSVSKQQAKLLSKVAAFQAEMVRTFPQCTSANQSLEQLLAALAAEAARQGVVFVQGKGKRKTSLQRAVETARSYQQKLLKYKDYQDTFQGRKSFSKTDPDATFMRMKEDHMRNGQLKPGYNLVLGVEAEYVVGALVSSERSDSLTLLPLLARMEAGLKRRHRAVVLDAGFESEENYAALLDRGQEAYIKPKNYEKTKERAFRKNAFLRENMPYDPESDAYTCPAGKQLTAQYETNRKSKSGFLSRVTVYVCDGCVGCPQKSLCTRAKENRSLHVSKRFDAFRRASLARITSPHGIVLRMNRSIQSEGAFGVLKEDYGFRRFLRRGAGNVFTELLLYLMAFNVSKLHAKKTQNRCGVFLHLPDTG